MTSKNKKVLSVLEIAEKQRLIDEASKSSRATIASGYKRRWTTYRLRLLGLTTTDKEYLEAYSKVVAIATKKENDSPLTILARAKMAIMQGGMLFK